MQHPILPSGHRQAHANELCIETLRRSGDRNRGNVGGKHHNVIARAAQKVLHHAKRDYVELPSRSGKHDPVTAPGLRHPLGLAL